jgi:hypothetical protein
MDRKTAIILLLLASVILAGAPEAFAKPQYFNALTAVYGSDYSCGTCHVNPNGDGPRNSYGTLFESQPNHRADPGAALTAIGSPSSSTATPLLTPAATMTPAPTLEVTTVSATGTPAAPGFGIVASLMGLFAWALLVKRNNS